MNSLSSLFHHGLVKILLVSHLSQIGDNWEGFLSRNGFTQVDDTVIPHLIVNPNLDIPVYWRSEVTPGLLAGAEPEAHQF
jgi:hypothetical protein